MFLKFYSKYIVRLGALMVLFVGFVYLVGPERFTVWAIALISILLTIQALFTIIWMTYAWDDPKMKRISVKADKKVEPHFSFSIFIPALHEEEVIAKTIESMAEIDYPKDKYEVFVINRSDDSGTISEVQKTMDKLRHEKGIRNIFHLIPDFRPRNKPDKLNYALTKAKNDVIVIFDAEDQVHPDILSVANAEMIAKDVDILQGGVQLMNYRSTWFSALNCLEYYYWFKSALHFFTNFGVTPLGGVTVFFKRSWVNKLNGWDADCLTEDADIGFRLSLKGAKIGIFYDEAISTRESTPLTVESFVKQRTRWDLGFIQVFAKGDWAKMDSIKKKLMALYVLSTPLGQSMSLIFIPFMLALGIVLDLPVFVSILSLIPMFLMGMILVTEIIILYDFTRSYDLKYPFWLPLKILIVFIPYIFMLSIAAVRGIWKYFAADFAWEKTPHNNTHREQAQPNIQTQT